MRRLLLERRNLTHHWRSYLAIALGVAAGTASLTGALLVGDSMRGSLRALALDRLAGVSYAVQSPGYFREELANAAAADAQPMIIVRGGATRPDRSATAAGVQVMGVQPDFLTEQSELPPRGVILNTALADELWVSVGDDVLLRIPAAPAISPETLLGRRDTPIVSLRLTVAQVLPDNNVAGFSLVATQATPRNAFVPLPTLQRALEQEERANTIVSRKPISELQLSTSLRLADYGITLRTASDLGYVALEHDALLIPPAIETLGREAADAAGLPVTGALAGLAIAMQIERDARRSVPYSTVAGVEPLSNRSNSMTALGSGSVPVPEPGTILLNDWAANDLGATVGDMLRLTYYVTDSPGELQTESTTFRVAGVVPLAAGAADPGLVPEYPGVSDATRISDWDPPFPIDLARIRDKDEAYWNTHRATPKAFVTLADAQRLWATLPNRFGRVTSLRVVPPAGDPLEPVRSSWEEAILSRANLSHAAISIVDVRARALDASQGATDFSSLFVGFSMFVIAAAAMLVALLFRLHVEQRGRTIGLWLALGFTRRNVALRLWRESMLVAVYAAVVGLLAARGYAALMLHGLRTWWSDATNAPFLTLHETDMTYVVGLVASLLIASVALAWALRGLTRVPVPMLLAGATQVPEPSRKLGRRSFIPAILGYMLALTVIALSAVFELIAITTAFFVAGVVLLVSELVQFRFWLRGRRTSTKVDLVELAERNLQRAPGRSLLVAALVASATFLIVALQAMRLTPTDAPDVPESPTGGFTLIAETTVPLLHNPGTNAGRTALDPKESTASTLSDTRIYPFRLRDGDATSCLNLYRPREPRLLGATQDMIHRGGFRFGATTTASDAERDNPWLLLNRQLPDGVVPAIADEASALWQLHKNLGDEIEITAGNGTPTRLKLVALTRGSILQGELIIAEEQFVRLFPRQSGYAFFLLETPPDQVQSVESAAERAFADYGFATTSTRERQREFFAVQNTYLSTFQALGGLGLLIGTFGLAAALLRGIWERRGELALLRTLGFSRTELGFTVLVENAFLVGIGLLSGAVAAAVVIAPHVYQRGINVPWFSLAAMLLGIFVAGLLAGTIAVATALWAPLLPALRSE